MEGKGRVVDRIDYLRQTSSHIKFLSLEPLLGPFEKLELTGIDWVIVGGESGPGARPMKPEWAQSIRDICLQSNTPFFFKQWGGVNKKKAGRMLENQPQTPRITKDGLATGSVH